jgi:glycogen synthase
MVVFAKACLELTIQINKIPMLVVTNDWFTSLIAAYARNKNFGEYFN